jgi:hypothetical protein
MWRLSKHFGISDVALAKHCRKVGVPLPKRGYWNKLQAGHKVTKTPLPERDLATVNLITMTGVFPPQLRDRIAGEPGIAEPGNDDIEVLASRFRKRLGKVAVPRDFAKAHPIIAALLKKDDEYRQELLTNRYSWKKPRFDSPFEQRRLRFLNSLFLGFARVGGSASVRGEDARELAIYIGSASVRFKLDRPERSTRRGSKSAAEPREKLCLTISDVPDLTTSWADNDGLPLERQITDVIVGMLVASEHQHRRWLQQQAEWERQRREEEKQAAVRRKEDEKRQERERLAAIEEAKRDQLLKDAEAWRKANNLRDYVQAVRSAASELGGAPDLERWSHWALREADKLDPISSGKAIERLTFDATSLLLPCEAVEAVVEWEES